MNTVIRHIEYLIAHKDCVIIPGVGAILATYISARVDKATSLLMPPERVYTFNKDINHNDGTLACSIARAEMIRYELACKKMESEIEEMQHILHAQGTVSIGRIGAIHYNKQDDTIQFEPSTDQKSACPNMWLPTLKVGNKISVVTRERLSTSDRIVKSPIVVKHRSIFRRISGLAASLALVLGICYLATLLPVSHDNDAMKASLAPDFNSANEENTEIVKETLSIIPSEKYKSYSEIDAEAVSTEAVSTINADPTATDSPKFYVVVAAVHNNEEAEQYMSQHSGESLHAMPYKNLYVVYNSISSTKEDAYKLCCESAKKYPGAWICSK